MLVGKSHHKRINERCHADDAADGDVKYCGGTNKSMGARINGYNWNANSQGPPDVTNCLHQSSQLASVNNIIIGDASHSLIYAGKLLSIALRTRLISFRVGILLTNRFTY